MAEVRDLGLDQRCRILAGVGPVRSLRALAHLRGLPGVHIPGEVDRRLRAVPAARVAEEGLAMCAEIIEQVRQIPGVSGVHVMAPGHEQTIPETLGRAGSASGPARMAPAPTGTGPRPSARDRSAAVLIDVRPVTKLTGPDPVDVASALAPVFSARVSAAAARLDLATLRVVCDWIQYRHNFYEPVEARPVLAERPHRPEREGGARPPKPPWRSPSTCAAAARPAIWRRTSRRRWPRAKAAARQDGSRSSRGSPPAKAACGSSTRCTGRRCPAGRRPPGGSTSRRSPGGRARPAIPTPPAT